MLLLSGTLTVGACAGGDGPDDASRSPISVTDVPVSTDPSATTAAVPTGDGVPIDDVADIAGVEWQLASYALEGGDEQVPPDDEVRIVRFDGRGGYTIDGCNHSGGEATIDGGTMSAASQGSTLVGCVGIGAELDGVLDALLRDGTRWSAVGDRLVVVGGGVRAELAPRDPPFPHDPNVSPRVVVEELSDGSGPQYRISVSTNPLGWGADLVAREAAGLPWGHIGGVLAPTSDVGPATFASVTTVGDVLLGYVAASSTTARASFVGDDGTEVPFEVIELDAEHRVLVGAVSPVRPGLIVQWDVAGTEVSRSQALPQEW
jgi:heat shock protein HslJ